MTDTLGLHDIAMAWVAALAQRGVRLEVRGKKLLMIPKSAYGEMSADERRTLKLHKQAIVDIVKGGRYATATSEPATAKTPVPPEPCPYCRQAPCIGPDHFAFSTLHDNDPVEVKRREAGATAEMFESMRRARGGWR